MLNTLNDDVVDIINIIIDNSNNDICNVIIPPYLSIIGPKKNLPIAIDVVDDVNTFAIACWWSTVAPVDDDADNFNPDSGDINMHDGVY